MLVREAITIRPYQADDVAFIARLAHEAFDEFTPRAVSHTLDMVSRFTTLVALRAGRRVGFIAVDADQGGIALLHAIAVAGRERGRGIGQRLMITFERLAYARGARRLELCTADCNLAALDLFLRSGFRLQRRRQRFYDRGQDACILVKDLVLGTRE
jgi:dTDP-4-amino-4,6-dideoxy-D-galactose acyltransferase